MAKPAAERDPVVNAERGRLALETLLQRPIANDQQMEILAAPVRKRERVEQEFGSVPLSKNTDEANYRSAVQSAVVPDGRAVNSWVKPTGIGPVRKHGDLRGRYAPLLHEEFLQWRRHDDYVTGPEANLPLVPGGEFRELDWFLLISCPFVSNRSVHLKKHRQPGTTAHRHGRVAVAVIPIINEVGPKLSNGPTQPSRGHEVIRQLRPFVRP